jgi:dephospho-CoA kinase
MLSLKKIAITGGIASGKSSVCQFFKELGAYVIHADAIVHKLLDSKTHLGQQIIREFGPEITQNGQIDRRQLADRAFKDPKQLKKLEGLLHPAVMNELEESYLAACQKGSYTSFVAEVPLLYEIEADSFYDVVIAVIADETKAKERFEQRGFTDYTLRMKQQLTPQEKAKRAHYTIYNNGSLEELRQEVIKLDRIIHQK